ncbi:MAG: peptidoglycan DD-metalloendopeptidase family protein [Bacteroidaceae bacterium]|nr:peptidoglycan DD-metalloendopeptidase family protein [Bacteroidaceae bacterium]
MNRHFVKHILLFFLFAAFVAMPLSAQRSVKEMRKRAGNLQKQIAEKESILKSSQKDVKSKLQNLDLLSAKIKERKQLIVLLNDEVGMLNDTIEYLKNEINAKEQDVAKSKNEYAQALRRARNYNSFQNKLLFIVSAKDFNMMLRRYRYAREYMNAHKKAGERLQENISMLNAKKSELDTIRAGKEEALAAQNRESESLKNLQSEQRKIVDDLQRESKKVQRELKKQRQQLNELNAKIDRIIEQEIEKQRKRELAEAKAREKAKNKQGGTVAVRNNEGVSKMSGSFLQNKGRLPAPITGPYHVVNDFGKRQGVMGKGNVLVDNGGIVIQGREGAQARCIFEGTVTAVFRTTDYALVLVRHGKYLSVYCQLDKIHVKDGDVVKAGTIIGDIAKNSSGHTRLLFQLRNEKVKLNPMQWLKL